MAKQFFVLGIGGTGMRCIESLIHLCAMGMFDDTDIHLLALDTDSNNGNFNRLKALKDAYQSTKGNDEAQRVALKDSFFTANIKYYEFSPNYQTKSTFKAVFDYGNTQYQRKEEADLADLVLSSDVEDFNLRHGYRAQTHLGSMMMYHSIIEAAKEARPNDLQKFLSTLTTACTSGNPRVFILGSVFGGTGASSIPIIPQALTKAAEIINGGAVNILRSAYFGSTLLTGYFNFKSPSESELQNQKVIATSERFALNSQVAMMFYDDDTTVKSTYQRFYMLGTDGLSWNPMQHKEVSTTITGGELQENDSHYIELMAACAALDFYNSSDNVLNTNKANQTTDYVYRSIGDNGKLEFQDFVGKDREKEFAKKLGLLVAFALFCNGSDDILEGLRTGTLRIEGYSNIEQSQIAGIKDYFRLFFAKRDSENPEKLKEGWLKQLHRSIGGEDKLLLNAALFAPSTFKDLMKLDWNKKIYRTEGLGKDHFYSKFMNSKFNDFKKELNNTITVDSDAASITNPTEKVYKLVYDTLSKLYKFND